MPVLPAGAATAQDADFERLEEAWSEARAEWLAAESAAGPKAAGPKADGSTPDALFSRAFEQLAARGNGPAALWRLVHFRSALGLAPADDLPADKRASLLEAYARLVDEHADEVELLVPAFFERLALESDLTDYEIDGICARLEMAGRHPEVQARSILLRAERTAPLGCESPLDQAIAGILLDRIFTEYSTTTVFVEAVEARWRLDHLAVGQTPPGFATADLAGNEIVLGDFTGRVRVVAFLGDDVERSLEGFARAAELQSRYWDEPFAWIGIHEHPDPAALELLLQEPNALGTHAYEGTGARPAVEAWRIHRRPLTFLLDGQGRVRGVDLDGEGLNERIRLLLEELADQEVAGPGGPISGSTGAEPGAGSPDGPGGGPQNGPGSPQLGSSLPPPEANPSK